MAQAKDNNQLGVDEAKENFSKAKVYRDEHAVKSKKLEEENVLDLKHE